MIAGDFQDLLPLIFGALQLGDCILLYKLVPDHGIFYSLSRWSSNFNIDTPWSYSSSNSNSSIQPFPLKQPFPAVFSVLISKKRTMADYIFSENGSYYDDVPLSYRFVRLGLNVNLPG